MDFKSVSVNNCYILRNEVFDNHFFTYINAKAVYSASIFHLAFFKGNIKLLPEDTIKEYEQLLIKLYRLNSPYLYIPFEINFHEEKLYQSYYESDHFPLSLWLEEKNLIPFDIFIRIMEDLLFALKVLEKNGINHSFLTPEEILVPLQWTASSHVKLYNVGINLLISSLMNDNEIDNYRKNYYKNRINKSPDKLSLNIADDLYSFSKIMSQLFTFCNFNNDETKHKIQGILNNILNNYKIFTSIEEVITLFDDYFLMADKKNILPDKAITNTYSGQAGFIIPEFDEWKEEAELELLTENIDKNSTETIKKIEKKSLYISISSIFKSFFSRKKKRKEVSNTLKEYTKRQDTITPETKTNFVESDSDINNDLKENNGQNNTNNIFKQTEVVLKKIDEHYTSVQNQNKEKKDKSEIKHIKNAFTVKAEDSIQDLTQSIEYTKADSPETDSKFYINFNKSLEERNYKRTYEIIQESIKSSPKEERSKQELRLKNLLDEKLKQLDNHYIKNDSTNILDKISILNNIQPMEISKPSKEAEEFNALLKKEYHTKNNSNFFIMILLYIKKKIEKLIK